MEFVDFNLAKKLKEKGFRELCLVYYTNDDTLYYNYSHKAGACHKNCYFSHNLMPKDSVSGKFVDAPTISQVLKWLREKKEIYIVIEPFPTMSTKNKICWSWDFKWNSDGAYIEHRSADDTTYATYEQAALAAIDYIVDNLI